MFKSAFFALCLIFLNKLQISNLFVLNNETYYKLPRFWTNTGFCPFGGINHKDISESLLSDDVKTSLLLISSLPNSAIASVRVHWLLELVSLKANHQTTAEYDFGKLDAFLQWMDTIGLAVGFELMGNPGGVFTKNSLNNQFLWEDLVFQIGKRYLNRFGPDNVRQWRFESWNEPDLKTYNILNFTTDEYWEYLEALRFGLDAAGRRPINSVHFPLRGPAGLFKSSKKHPLCWSSLQKCNQNPKTCPFEVLTFHRKGRGVAKDIVIGGQDLLKDIFSKYTNLSDFPVSNDEADPISGWSVPRSFQSDVRYAVKVVMTILQHWSAKLNSEVFKNLESISHDNAFLSYHPHEFTQRTLFARFRMNQSLPHPYSQFIQKPVFVALGMLGNLGTVAKDVQITTMEGVQVHILETGSSATRPLFLSWVAVSLHSKKSKIKFPLDITALKSDKVALIMESLDLKETNPAKVWKSFKRPAYPNATVREQMRRAQGPRVVTNKLLTNFNCELKLRPPFVAFIRICSLDAPKPPTPFGLRITKVTDREALISWKEDPQLERCLKTYEVHFSEENTNKSTNVAKTWHVPFLSFHFQPAEGNVYGSYKVRGVDIFGRLGNFSQISNYKQLIV